MKITRWMSTASLLCALALPQPAMAQEHGSHGETGHGQTEQTGHGETGHGEQAHSEGEHGAHASHGPEEINWTTFGGTRRDHAGNTKPNPPPFIATLINFGLLVAILFFAVKRAINPSLATRRAAVEAEIAEAQRRLAEAEAQLREFKDKLANSKDEFARIRDELVKAGETEAQKILDEARAKAERMQSEGQALIDQEVRNLRADLIREAVEAAVKSAEQTVRSSVNGQDQSRLADAFLDGLDKVATSDRGSV
jgi:F-type H+-transporting ATPase subunit b